MPLNDELYVYVIDGSEGFWDNPTDWLDSLFTVQDILVTSVQDMVLKIEAKCDGTSKVKNLFIGGHGAPGFQSVGAGSGGDASGARSLQVGSSTGTPKGNADRWMRRLAPTLTSDAIVTLGGCRVGTGQDLLRTTSMALGGVPVQAGTDNQRPLFPGMEGDVIRCKGLVCKNLGGGSWWASPGSWVQ